MRSRAVRSVSAGLLAAALLIAGASALLIAGPAEARPPATTAVLDLVSEGVPAEQARALSALLRSELAARAPFTVLNRSDLYQQLDPRERERAAGCASLDCAVAIGRRVEVERVVLGHLRRIDERRLRIQVSLFHVPGARALGITSRESEDDSDSLREETIPRLARELAHMDKDKGNASLWLFLVGGAGAAVYVFTRDGGGKTETGAAEITGTFPPDAFPSASGRPASPP